jgi:membrane-associated phospholipid phosphatase
MMKKLLFVLCLLGVTTLTNAEELKLTVPELVPKLVYSDTPNYIPELEMNTVPVNAVAVDKWTWMETNPGVKPYQVMDDLTFVGVPLFVAGWAIKGDKAMFRVNNKEGKKNTQLLTDFKTGIDDYTQFFGPAMVVGLKVGGYEGRSDWGRLLASAGMSYAIMAGFVNGIKYTAKEMRPDGSTRNSWPSGHTATSFVGATLLHKEYGLTRSPWFSVAGYGVATATGVMRVLNNRHWVSDVMSGAGIGILSTELGYALGDVLFKGKGLLRNDLLVDSENPSFFGISMGVGISGKDVTFTGDDLLNKEAYDAVGLQFEGTGDGKLGIDFRAATVVDAEGAYFFNKYVGVGGRFRVRAMSAKNFGDLAEMSDINEGVIPEGWADICEMYDDVGMDLTLGKLNDGGAAVSEMGAVVKSDHLAEFTASAGLYFNIPLNDRFSLGTKCLIGRSITQELDIDGYAKGYVKDIDYSLTIKNGEIVGGSLDYPKNTPTNDQYDTEWDFLTLGATNSTSWGTGLSLTYRYKSNFSWRIYCDYDYTKKTFTMTYDPNNYLKSALTPNAYGVVSMLTPYPPLMDETVFKRSKKMNYFTAGISFLVNL